MRNFKVFNKMLMIIMTSFILILCTGAYGLFGLNSVNNNLKEMYTNNLISIDNLELARLESSNIKGGLFEYMTHREAYGNTDATAQKLNTFILNTEASLKNMEDYINTYISTPTVSVTEDDERVRLTEAYKNYVVHFNKFITIMKKENLRAATENYYEQLNIVEIDIRNQLTDLAKVNQDVAEKNYLESQKRSKSVSFLIYMTIAISLVAITIIGLLISRMVSKPIEEVRKVMQLAQEGDLTVQANYYSKDELGQLVTSFNAMSSSLQASFQKLLESTNRVTSSTQEVNSSAEASSSMTEQIVQNVEDVNNMMQQSQQNIEMTSHTIRDMSDGIHHVVKQTQSVSDIAKYMVSQVVQGNKQSEDTTAQMQNVTNKFDELELVLNRLANRSTQINQIIGTITEIATQTGLLSLNASIEAARAGEHGNGFMVVANEVRKLADQSAKSATKITDLIETIQVDTSNAVKTMDVVKQELQAGMKQTTASGDIFAQVKDEVEGIATRIDEVFATMEEMSAGSEQINTTMSQFSGSLAESVESIQLITAGTQEQMASIEEIAAATTQLSQMSAMMQREMKQFKVS